jgi:hypothetical protein
MEEIPSSISPNKEQKTLIVTTTMNSSSYIKGPVSLPPPVVYMPLYFVPGGAHIQQDHVWLGSGMHSSGMDMLARPL